MKLSYIKPRRKTIFTKDALLLLLFFSVTISMLIGTYAYLIYRDQKFSDDKAMILKQKEELELATVKAQKDSADIEKKRLFFEQISTKNSLMSDSIQNLFDLVPSSITLSEARLLEKGLVLYGHTPSKDVYNFMLAAPLHAIFHRTYTSFYPIENGWYSFVSTNHLDDENSITEEPDEE